MSRFITADQFKFIAQIPRKRLSSRVLVYCGAIIEKEGKILMVRASDALWPGFDFPGGRMLWSENIMDCVNREVLEESRYKINIERFLGIYQRNTREDGEDYLRFLFTGKIKDSRQLKKGDPNIVEVRWVDIKKIINNEIQLRSTEVSRELRDYLKGISYPLDIVSTYVW